LYSEVFVLNPAEQSRRCQSLWLACAAVGDIYVEIPDLGSV